MPERTPPPRPVRPLLWALWYAWMLLWTAALLAPLAGTSLASTGQLTFTWKVIRSKALHLAAYAVWSYLTARLQVPPPRRLWLLFLLMLHAPLTELIQVSVPGRGGSLIDVLLDHAGVGIGLGLGWKWWSAGADGGEPAGVVRVTDRDTVAPRR